MMKKESKPVIQLNYINTDIPAHDIKLEEITDEWGCSNISRPVSFTNNQPILVAVKKKCFPDTGPPNLLASAIYASSDPPKPAFS